MKAILFLLVVFAFNYQIFGQSQVKLVNLAASAAHHLANKNYSSAIKGYNLCINNPFFTDTKKWSKRDRKERPKALATLEYSRASALALSGDYEAGLKNLEAAIKVYPNFSLFKLYKAIYQDNFFDNNIDVEALKSNYEPYQNFPDITSKYAKVLNRRGYFKEVLAIYNKTLKKEKSPFNYYNAARLNKTLGNSKQAKKLFEKGLDAFPTQKSPDNCSYQSIHILFLQKLGKEEEALKLAKEILDNNPNDYCAKQNIALLYYRTESYQEAIESYQKLVNENPYHDEGFIHLIKSYDQLGETERALTMLNDLLIIYPNYAMALTEQAAILSQRGMYDKAKIAINSAIKLMPNHPLIQLINSDLQSK